MSKKNSLLSIVVAAICLVSCGSARSQAYTSIVVFGDSLTDVGNDAAVSYAIYGSSAQVPGPATGYTNGRFTDGLDTLPAARNYTGVWAEQLAAMLPAKPVLKNSLAGGTDYAYGFATTNTGTSVFSYGPGNVLSFNVNNMGQQVSDYLATNPVITSKTLYIVWGGANDLIAATSTNDIVNAALRDAAIVQQLISAGATDIIVPNLPPLGLVPRFNGSPATSVPATQACALYDQTLAAALAGLPAANPGVTLHLFPLDTYTLFNTIVGPPVAKGFANVTASSQGVTTVNPDTYLFWDDLHPTTYGHSLLASAAFTLIGPPVITTTTLTSSIANANLGASVALTASVADSSGTPIGYVTFYDGTTPIYTGLLSGSTTTATTTFTTSALLAGTHPITAKYAGVNGYVSSNSAIYNQVVTAPALNVAFLPSTIVVASGGSGTSSLTFNPVGGYSGTATVACGTLPTQLTCAVTSTPITFKGDNTQQTAIVAIGTVTSAALHQDSRPGTSGLPQSFFALTLLPCFGLMGFAAVRRRRRDLRRLWMLVLLTLGISGGLLGLSGCNSNSNHASPGNYTVPVNVTVGGATTAYSLTVVVQ
jgi:phospholipase/lecithinase/hemolysin